MSLHARLPPIQAPAAHPQYHPNNPYESSSATSTISPQSPGSAMVSGGLPNAPRSADARSFPVSGLVRPSSESGPRYGVDYDSTMSSPGYEQYGAGAQTMTGSPHQSHPVPGGQLPQKRAYRQRRKDPSCDACRERKVKCDATDTSSCSECSSRNVKCQFTKETNRRMSSIKQVQDLEKQLFVAKEMVSRYESVLQTNGIVHPEIPAYEDEDYTVGASSPSKRRKPQSLEGDGPTSQKMDEQMEMILKPMGLDGSSDYLSQERPRDRSGELDYGLSSNEALLTNFHTSPLSKPRIIAKSSTRAVFETLQRRPRKEMRQDKLAMILGCLACGALQQGVEHAAPFLAELEQPHFSSWFPPRHRPTLDIIRTTVLLSILRLETNDCLGAYLSIKNAVSYSRAIGIDKRIDSGSRLDSMYLNLWNAVAWWDVTISLELGRTSDIQPYEISTLASSESTDSDLSLGLTRLAVAISKIHSAFKPDNLPTAKTRELDDLLSSFLSPFDESDSVIPRFPWLDIHALSALFIVRRHHINPQLRETSAVDNDSFFTGTSRHVATNDCLRAASDTVKLMDKVRRKFILHDGDDESNLVRSIISGQTSRLITHLWRCTIICLFAFRLSTARALARHLALAAPHRPVGEVCVQFIKFFIGEFRKRLSNGMDAMLDDEQLITFASADMQLSTNQGWTWTDRLHKAAEFDTDDDEEMTIQDAEGRSERMRHGSTPTAPAFNPDQKPKPEPRPLEKAQEDWRRILEDLERLEREVQPIIDAANAVSTTSLSAGAPNSVIATQMPAESKFEASRVNSGSSASSSNRMKIADLMG